MAKTKFPIVVKRGSASVKIYLTPDTQKAGPDGKPVKVAEETGNSPQMIRENYLELVTPKEAEAWFAIKPVPAESTTAEAPAVDAEPETTLRQTKRRKASASPT